MAEERGRRRDKTEEDGGASGERGWEGERSQAMGGCALRVVGRALSEENQARGRLKE